MNHALATCTYQEFTADMGHPVRTTVGAPRFPLGYALVGHATLLTPARAMLGLSYEAYKPRYLQLLDSAGIDAIRAELDEIADGLAGGRPLVLLCFDRLDKPGAWCHRQMAAAWLQERAGIEVPELGALPTADPPSLFDL
ncbi:hypothetical protein [Nonomuraea angiospora]|uniref:hypothetical protein n=1 Tax=Nonomuraea angiospora TaxID=46172 RepID=UPI0029A2A8BC|nr:hypothetical protein [Nonomuraea angiospora]MDX3100488.1 hypothetical protein [Nonomuraea angiospora]